MVMRTKEDCGSVCRGSYPVSWWIFENHDKREQRSSVTTMGTQGMRYTALFLAGKLMKMKMISQEVMGVFIFTARLGGYSL
jgi:hypothetical protein